jgi:hypothetical protein
MNITGLISGIVMLMSPSADVELANTIYKTMVTTAKVIEKTEDGTWGASAHEEGYQITKDTILIIGGVK